MHPPAQSWRCADSISTGAVPPARALHSDLIQCAYSEGGVEVGTNNTIVIDAPSGTIVALRGLDIHGGGTAGSGITFRSDPMRIFGGRGRGRDQQHHSH